MSSNAAQSLGSAEGSFLYEIGGFNLPYYVNSGFIILLIPLTLIYFPSNQ